MKKRNLLLFSINVVLSMTIVWGFFQYVSAQTTQQIENSAIYQDGSNNIGIGTTGPGAKLDIIGAGGSSIDLRVNGRIQSNSASGGIWVNNTGTQFFGSVAANTNGIYNAGWHLAVVDNGNVGIGTTSPVTKFAVSSGGTQGLEFNPIGAGPSNAAYLQSYNRSTSAYTPMAYIGSSHDFWTPSTGYGSLFINSVGNVGLGTSTPVSRLTVGNGSYPVFPLPGINVATGGNSYISISDNVRQAFLGVDTSNYGMVGTLSNHDFVTRTNNTERLRVTATGNVGIGTSSPVSKLHIYAGDIVMNSGAPTIYYQDWDNYSAMTHVNGNQFYILSGCGVNSLGWCVNGGGSDWPLRVDLPTGNVHIGGSLTLVPRGGNPPGLTNGMMWMVP